MNWLRIKLASTFFLAFSAIVGVLMALEWLIGGKPLALGLAISMVAWGCWFVAGEVLDDRRYKETKTQGFEGA